MHGKLEITLADRLPRRWWLSVLGLVALILSFLCWGMAGWYRETYGDVGFDGVLYTLTSALDGVDTNLVRSCLRFLAKRLPWLLLGVAVLFGNGKRRLLLHRRDRTLRLYPLSGRTAAVLTAAISLLLVGNASKAVGLDRYVMDIANPSALFEEEYRYSDDGVVTFPEEKRNLIYIFLESMETTFFSQEQGGALQENVIPELYQLALENVNFSHNDGVGGFTAVPGATWTIGGMVGQTAGIPLKTPPGVSVNGYGQDGDFLPGASSLMKILRDAGYRQAVLFGSDGYFGGRTPYYVAHGCYEVYDLRSARASGIIPADYHNAFWGMEDLYLYEYARELLTDLSSQETPFALTLLTVDTHHVGGYVCELCGEDHEEQYENVYRCASRQLADFLQWLQQQDYYEDTTIVIAGDHLSMDGGYMRRNVEDPEVRRVYNCFVNAAVTPENTRNRQMCTYDMFPTTLAAMGCSIAGERLGLGTNLFSDTPTLMEQMGAETFTSEVARYSRYYADNFY